MSSLLLCANLGCRAETFTEANNDHNACIFHPSKPYFHEAQQIWPCCEQKSYSFDDFLKIPGCARGPHKVKEREDDTILAKSATPNASSVPASTDLGAKWYIHWEAEPSFTGVFYNNSKTEGLLFSDIRRQFAQMYNAKFHLSGDSALNPSQILLKNSNGRVLSETATVGKNVRKGDDVYATQENKASMAVSEAPAVVPMEITSSADPPAPQPAPQPTLPLDPYLARTCLNWQCTQPSYRECDNSDTACNHHPMPPMFHEGSKGYQCCDRFTTLFDDFTRFKTCAVGRHSDTPHPLRPPYVKPSKNPTWDQTQTHVVMRIPVTAAMTGRVDVELDDGTQLMVTINGTDSTQVFNYDLFKKVKPNPKVSREAAYIQLQLRKDKDELWKALEA